MQDEEPISAAEIRSAQAWIKKWRPVKWTLIAFMRLFRSMAPWVLALGIGASALVDAWHKWTGGGHGR